jgi:hypothetical protein
MLAILFLGAQTLTLLVTLTLTLLVTLTLILTPPLTHPQTDFQPQH